jgi:hypothetical protein
MTSTKHSNGRPFEIRRSPISGKGVFATRRIRKGRRIIEYVGELVSEEEATRRYDDESMETHHTFLFEIDDNTFIDASVNGNEARFINHSCDPNCEAVDEDGRIFIEAVRNIQPGVELTYDYDPNETKAAALKRYPCRCGAKNCRGTIVKFT